MSGLCGWFCAQRADAAGPEVIASMAPALNRFDKSIVRIATTKFGAVASAALRDDTNVFQNEEYLAAVWGHASFTDIDLDQIAQRDGAARALALGYTLRQEGVF